MLLVARDLELAFAGRPVLVSVSIELAERDRVGLVGTNGSGKSTLMRILAGQLEPDGGRVERRGSLAILDQSPDLGDRTVGEVLTDAVKWHGDLLAGHQRALESGDDREASRLQDRLDTFGWEIGHRVRAVCERLSCPPPEARTSRLSGGEARRVALARTLLSDAEILLLDEPTNHLDAEAVEWLEAFLRGFRGAVLLVTHDRYLLESVAERIVEIDQGRSHVTEGSWADYLVERADRHARLGRRRDQLLRTIASEAEWASRSPAARTVKQKARLLRLDGLREQVPTLKDRSFSIALATGVPAGVTLIEGHGLTKRYGDRTLFRDVGFVLRPRERVGIVGPNGAGKSTLLRIVGGMTAPDAGTVVKGPKAKIGVLDQERTGLDPDETLFEAAGGGNDHVKLGDAHVHVITFLERFAFDREQVGMRTRALSGGERARLLLAKRMLEGATVLLLDEPTNDLDLDTLRVLEEALLGFDGGAVVVTHDRAFLDRVCTSVLAVEEGRVEAFANRTQWLAARASRAAERAARAVPAPKTAPLAPKVAKLSWAERKELDGLPERIEALEAEVATLDARLGEPATWADRGAAHQVSAEADALRERVREAYARWETLAARE